MGKFKTIFRRVEKKYILHAEQYQELRRRLEGIAQVDEYGESSIYNIYYDTPEYHLIRQSLRKPLYKEKLRLRTYGIPQNDTPAFLEIKKKYKGVVYKRRVDLPYTEAVAALAGKVEEHVDTQIGREIDYFTRHYNGLHPVMAIAYDRVALVGCKDPELRITFDSHIRYSTTEMDLRGGVRGKELLPPGDVLMEIKISGALPIALSHIFSELRIYPTSFSKYGRAYAEVCAAAWRVCAEPVREQKTQPDRAEKKALPVHSLHAVGAA